MRSFRIIPVVLLVAAASTTTACGKGGDQANAAPHNSATAASTVELDTYRPEDAAFFDRFQTSAVTLIRPPRDLAAGAKAATAVIVAEVADVRRTRVVGPPEAKVPMTGVVLRPVETLHGKLRPELKEVVVEFLGGESVDSPDPVAKMRASLPRGKSVWFLRWQGTPSPNSKPGARPVPEESKAYYNIVHVYGGIFVQGAETVVSPATPGSGAPPGPTMRKAGERLEKLSELAEKTRAVSFSAVNGRACG